MPRLNTMSAVAAVALATALPIPSADAAADLTIVGGTHGFIPGGAHNDILGPLFGQSGLGGVFGGQLAVTEVAAGAIVSLGFELLGYEAAYDNSFVFAGEVLFTSPQPRDIAEALDDPLSGFRFDLGPILGGPIDFGFGIGRTDGGVDVANGANPDDADGTAGANFFLGIVDEPAARAGRSAYVFLDDGGAGPDDDHDDMAVRITVTERPAEQDVSEPVTMALVGAGLVGAGLAARRRLSGGAGAEG
jgi:hypothetical protein